MDEVITSRQVVLPLSAVDRKDGRARTVREENGAFWIDPPENDVPQTEMDPESFRREFDKNKAAQMNSLSRAIKSLASIISELPKQPAAYGYNVADELPKKINELASLLIFLGNSTYFPLNNRGQA